MNSLFQISVLSFPMIFRSAFPRSAFPQPYQDFSNFRKRNMFQDLNNFRIKRTQMPNNFDEYMLDAYLRDNESKRSKYKSFYFIHYTLFSVYNALYLFPEKNHVKWKSCYLTVISNKTENKGFISRFSIFWHFIPFFKMYQTSQSQN